ncbi:hypothetical protein, partial [Paenibacillus maysiensis]|uniref:hypothetical protein n=1 Tax=Paenibacillus maysiensis TaxID=1155954 RepID=UPI001AE051B9
GLVNFLFASYIDNDPGKSSGWSPSSTRLTFTTEKRFGTSFAPTRLSTAKRKACLAGHIEIKKGRALALQ